MITQKRLLGYTVMLLLLSTGTGFAAHPLVSDDAGTLGKGNMQVELIGEISSNKDTVAGETTKTTGKQLATSFGVGLADKLDLSVGFARPWGNGNADGESFKDVGSADFSLSIKWQVYEHEGFSIALKPVFSYSYAVGISDDHAISYGAAAVLSKEFKPFSTHLNIDYIYSDHNLADIKSTRRSSTWSACIGTTYEIINDLKIVSDFGISTNEDKTTHNMPVFGLLGAIYTLNKRVDLSIGIKAGLTKPETDLTGTLGATLKFD